LRKIWNVGRFIIDKSMFKRIVTFLLLPILALVLLQGSKPAKKLKIGLCMDDYVQERWIKDQEAFIAKVEELGGQVLVEAARGNDSLQLEQAKKLIKEGVKVLVVVPTNAVISAQIVDIAHKAKVKVIAYDRIIKNADLDFYISYDNVKIGELQAKFVTNRLPAGNIAIIGGAPSDYNSMFLHEGQMNILEPFLERDHIKIVYEQFVKEWKEDEGYKHMEICLRRNKGTKIDAVILANDALAVGALKAIKEAGLEGQMIVTGQDADLNAVRSILKGSQSMTIYKPIEALAHTAAEAAVTLANKKTIKYANKSIFNGKIYVPSILLTPIVVDKDNIKTTVVADGHLKAEKLF
jgi:D-xylose transport system substrate-binding protein